MSDPSVTEVHTHLHACSSTFTLYGYYICSLRDVENSSLAPAMNGIVVHSKLVDHFEELLIDQADMSFLW